MRYYEYIKLFNTYIYLQALPHTHTNRNGIQKLAPQPCSLGLGERLHVLSACMHPMLLFSHYWCTKAQRCQCIKAQRYSTQSQSVSAQRHSIISASRHSIISAQRHSVISASRHIIISAQRHSITVHKGRVLVHKGTDPFTGNKP